MAQVVAGKKVSSDPEVVEIDVTPPDLQVTVSMDDPSSCELKVVGELDVASAPVLQTHLTNAFQSRVARVTIDLRDISFIDSTGLGVLVTARHRARSSGITVKMLLPKGPARFPFEITGLAELLETA